MDKQKIDAVIRYLHVHFPGHQVETKADFKYGAQAFKVHLDGGDSHLLKVSDELMDDTAKDQLPDLLNKMEAGEMLERGEGQGVFATSSGAKYFDRD